MLCSTTMSVSKVVEGYCEIVVQKGDKMMMKKIAIIVMLVGLCCLTFAQGIGVQGGPSVQIMRGNGVNLAFLDDAAVTFKFNEESPLVLGVNTTGSFSSFGVLADLWFIRSNLSEKSQFYIGLGAFADFKISSGVNVGGRLPIGATWFFLGDFLELYVQGVPKVGFEFGKTAGLNVSVPVNLGVRFWIKNVKNITSAFNGYKAAVSSAVNMYTQSAFTLAFNRAFWVGGLYPDYVNSLKEGQLISWKQTDSENEIINTELALLKKLPNGDSWWYISYSDDDDKLEFEALVNSNMELKKITYYDEEKKSYEDYNFATPTNANSEANAYAGYGLMPIDIDNMGDYAKGKESIRVPAGRFDCEKIVYEYGSSKELTSMIWWLSSSVPGQIVKYTYTNASDDNTIEGELIAIKQGITTKFKSF